MLFAERRLVGMICVPWLAPLQCRFHREFILLGYKKLTLGYVLGWSDDGMDGLGIGCIFEDAPSTARGLLANPSACLTMVYLRNRLLRLVKDTTWDHVSNLNTINQ